MFTNLFRALQMVKMINYSPFSNIGPLCLDVSVTSICNHNCYFCDEHSYLKTKGRKHETLPEPVLRNLFEDCVKLGVQEILLAGNGEPFFVKYLPKLIMEYGSKIKIKALTNGSTLSKIVTQQLLDNIYKLTISINSIYRETHKLIHGYRNDYQFDDIMKGIDMVLEIPHSRKKLQINYVLTADNIEEFDDVIDMSHNKDIYFAIRPVGIGFTEVKSKKLNKTLIKELNDKIDYKLKNSKLKKQAIASLKFARESLQISEAKDGKENKLLPCYSGFYWGFIHSNGQYSLCCHCDNSLGNIRENSFYEIWKSKQTQSIIYSTALMHESNIPYCSSCYKCGDPYMYSAIFHKYFSAIPLQSTLLRYWRKSKSNC